MIDAHVVKRNGKLLIINYHTDDLLYSLPDFLQVTSRQELWELAHEFTQKGCRDIDSVVSFESRLRDRQLSKRNIRV